MDEDIKKLDERLMAQHPNMLSSDDKERVWSAVRASVATMPRTEASPFVMSFFYSHTKIMIPTAIALILMLGAGTTVAAADGARPGDALFAIDRAAENVRIALASDDKKDELKVRFATERADEFDSIVEEERGKRLAMRTETETDTQTNAKMAREEAAPADDGADVALMATQATELSTFAATSDEDRVEIDEEGKTKIAAGLSTALSYITKASVELEAKGNVEAKQALDEVAARLEARLSEFPEDVAVEIRIDSDARVKLEFEESKSDEKDNESGRGVDNPRDFPDDDDSDDFNNDSDDDNGGSVSGGGPVFSGAPTNSDDAPDTLKIEVELENGVAKVEVEGLFGNDDNKEEFYLKTTDTAQIRAEIAERYGLSEKEVEAAMFITVINNLF